LFTDGITEAHNPDKELFDDPRLAQAASAAFAAGPQPVVQAVLDAVQTFSAGAQQADDYTLLAVQRLLT
jgi:sigma-B regulation protein RsbU (phosphoserine phosphatase)